VKGTQLAFTLGIHALGGVRVITDDMDRPWKGLKEVIESGDRRKLQSFLEDLQRSDVARAISRLNPDDQHRLLILLEPSDAADVIEEVPDVQAATIIEGLPPENAAAILDRVQSDQKADLLGSMEPTGAEAILAKMSPEDADQARRLITFPADSVGGIMITEYLSFGHDAWINAVLSALKENRRKFADFSVQYIYVTGDRGELLGVLPIRDLVFAAPESQIASAMIPRPDSVRANGSLSDLRHFFDEHKLVGAPVVDDHNRLVGVVRRAALEQASTQRITGQFLKFSGIIGGEEFRSMPFFLRSGRRLSWLSINIVLNIIAATVIAAYQDTLAAAITLAVFLPMISDMSGCSGNQAVAVSMRELALGLVRPNELFRVLGKEAGVGILNGIALGLLLGTLAFLWKGNPYLGLIVGTALAGNTVIAVSVGGVLPLLFKRLKLDPALVSGPALTTITDMFGFFLVLSLASILLSRL
jgi:magnesium transporter